MCHSNGIEEIKFVRWCLCSLHCKTEHRSSLGCREGAGPLREIFLLKKKKQKGELKIKKPRVKGKKTHLREPPPTFLLSTGVKTLYTRGWKCWCMGHKGWHHSWCSGVKFLFLLRDAHSFLKNLSCWWKIRQITVRVRGLGLLVFLNPHQHPVYHEGRWARQERGGEDLRKCLGCRSCLLALKWFPVLC